MLRLKLGDMRADTDLGDIESVDVESRFDSGTSEGQ